MKQSRYIINYGLICMSFLLLTFPHPVSAASKTVEKKVILTVVKGDTLCDISGKYLKERKQCRELARINHLINPDLIYPDQKLTIPVSLLKGTPMDGVVTFIKGDAKVQKENEEEWAVLHLRDQVPEGCGVKTGVASALELTFEDGSSLFQDADTDLKLSVTRISSNHLLRELRLVGGRTINRVKRATGHEQRFIIRTPSALAAMRGTEFRVSSDADKTTHLEVITGVVDVAAMGGDVEVKGHEGTAVKKGFPPIVPRKLLPPPQVVLRPSFNKLPLEFRFTGIAGAAAYRVLVTRDREGRDIVREEIIKPDVLLSISDIEDGPYFIQVMSIDDAGIAGAGSEPTPFQVMINPLPPFLRLPVEGTEFRSKTVELHWLKVLDAAGYHLQISADREFTKTVAEIVDLKDVGYTTKPLEFGQYFFRVIFHSRRWSRGCMVRHPELYGGAAATCSIS